MSEKHVSVLDKGEYLLVTCPPCYDADDCMACLDGMYDALELFGKSKVLADFTSTPEPIPIMVAHENTRPAMRYAAHRVRLAIVVGHGLVDTDCFLEQMAVRDKPINASVFEGDFDSAVSWLTS